MAQARRSFPATASETCSKAGPRAPRGATIASRPRIARSSSTWPSTLEVEIDDLGRVLFCHATPRSDEENVTRLTSDDDLAVALAGTDAEVVVGGHTHVQLDRRVPGGGRLVNAGSVGLPCQGEPGAFWAILGPDVELRRTPYDTDRALALLSASGFPHAGAFEDAIRGRIRAESATAYFESKRRAA